MLAAAFAIAAYATATSPEWVFDPPDPAFERSNTQSDGMTDRDVMVRLAIVRERSEYEQEIADEKAERAKRQSNPTSTRGMGGRRSR